MDSSKKELFFLILYSFLITAVAFFAGYFSHQIIAGNSIHFPLLIDSYNIIKNNGFKEMPDNTKIEYGMIRGMLQVYDDPYTSFFEPPQHELQINQLEGKYGGIGARLERNEENEIFLFPFPDSPAIEAGIIDGDKLIAIDNWFFSPETTSTDEVLAAIRGPINKKVDLTIFRQTTKEELQFTAIREEIPLPSVTWNITLQNNSVGIIRNNIISDTTPEEISKAIQDLQEKGASHFILDLRNNSGGLLDAGIDTAKLFLEEGVVITEQYKNKPANSYTITRPGPFVDIPLVILINNGTASAAEIIAGSLQSHQKGELIGLPSHGKDSIQLIYDLEDGSSLHVTSAKWWIPELEFPNEEGTGLIPDQLFGEEITNSDLIIPIAIDTLINN